MRDQWLTGVRREVGALLDSLSMDKCAVEDDFIRDVNTFFYGADVKRQIYVAGLRRLAAASGVKPWQILAQGPIVDLFGQLDRDDFYAAALLIHDVGGDYYTFCTIWELWPHNEWMDKARRAFKKFDRLSYFDHHKKGKE